MRLWCISYCNWKFSNMCTITMRKFWNDIHILKLTISYLFDDYFSSIQRFCFYEMSKNMRLMFYKHYEKTFTKKCDNICEKFQWWDNFEPIRPTRIDFGLTMKKFYQRRILFPTVRRASNSFIISKIIALRRCIIRAYSALRISAAWLSLEMFHLLQSRTIYRENLTFGYKLQYYHEHMRGVSKIYGLRDKLITFTAFYHTRPQCQK